MTARRVRVAGTRTFAAEVADFALEAGFEVIELLEPYDRGRIGQTILDRPVRWLDDGPGVVRDVPAGVQVRGLPAAPAGEE